MAKNGQILSQDITFVFLNFIFLKRPNAFEMVQNS